MAARSKSLKDPRRFDALVRKGMSKQKAAMISNGLFKKGLGSGKHRGSKKRRKR